MASKKRSGLGPNVGRILNKDSMEITAAIDEAQKDKSLAVQIPLNLIKSNPYQPRRIFDKEELTKLGNSIKNMGLIQPIVVKKDVVDYILVVGERRLRAAKLAGLTKIKAFIIDIGDTKMREYALVENIQRVDLTPIEEAVAYRDLLAVLKITQQELAGRVEKSRAYITNTIRLLQLPNNIQDLILERKISMGQARPLIALTNERDKTKLEFALQEILHKNLTTQKVEELVKRLKTTSPRVRRYRAPELINEKLASQIGKKINTKVIITNTSLVIKYKNVSQLNNILERCNLIDKD